jgi:hypothetical protein
MIHMKPKQAMKRLCQLVIAFVTVISCSAQTSPLSLPVGGLKAGTIIKFSGETTLREPDGLRGEYKFATPGQPQDEKQSGFVRVDLSGVNALRFKATLGGDFPLGDETQRRKVFTVRAADGTEARFLTVIEPYDDQPVVKSAVALSADKLRVELVDGRVQEIEIQNFDGDEKNITAQLTETKDGKVLRRETTEEKVSK